ncbi:MAG TPA: hypothetical protein VM241_00050 [Candidatus Thermoplasmatota archaeon]|nr:hypothetical protein [Candidatus Thermoplasmatota archaeon]
MDLGQRIRLVLSVAVLLALGALLFTFLLTVFLVFLAVGAVLALVLYVRFRLFARKVRKALQQQMAQAQASQPKPPASGGVLDADFKVEK